MSKKPILKSDLPDDPVGDALADVYFFLLQKAAERKRQMAALSNNGTVAGTSVGETETLASEVPANGRPKLMSDGA